MSNAPSEKWKIPNRLELFLKRQTNDKLRDVVLEVENEEFPVHRSILSSFSEYFFKMFTVDMKEKHSKVIKIEDITAHAMKEILNGIYVGEVNFTEDNIAEIVHAASMMQITCILDVASDYMLHNFSGKNCSLFLQLANFYSFGKVLEKANHFYLQNFDQVSKEECFLDLPIEKIVPLLKSDQLVTAGEERVFEFILRWVNKDLHQRKQYFPQLLKLVRLHFIPIKYVVDTIGKHELVKEFNECRDLVLDTVSYFITPTTSPTKPRCFVTDWDSLIFLSYGQCKNLVYNLNTKESKNIKFESNTSSTRLGCAVANKNLVTVLCGGSTSYNSKYSYKDVLRFDGFKWHHLPPMNTARCSAAAVFHNEKLYVFGGRRLFLGFQFPNFHKSFEVFEENSWKESNCEPRSHSAAISFENQIFLIGGYQPRVPFSFEREKQACEDVVIYNPVSGTWKKGTQMRNARADFGCTLWNSTIFAVGGFGQDNKPLNNVECLNLKMDICWTTLHYTSSYLGVLPSSLTGTFCSIGNKLYVCVDNTIYCVSFERSSCFESKSYQCKVLKEENVSLPCLGFLIPFTGRYFTNPL